MNEQSVEISAWRAGPVRIGLGLVQGVLAYALYESFKHHIWPGSDPVAHVAVAAAVLFAPLVLIGDLTAFRRPVLVGWAMAAGGIAAALTGYGAWRELGDGQTSYVANNGLTVVTPLFGLVAATLFIANHLIEASEIDRRPIGSYPNYFEPAWKHGLQIVLAVVFTAIFWGFLFLGAALFALIHISLLANVIKEPSFSLPATSAAFAVAVHLTDVRVGLVRGVRTVVLTLLAWLTPLLVLLAGGFVLALPFTGLEPLWKTKAAATILLSAASWLVLLINAAYQDGTEVPPAVLRWTVRAGALVLVPLVGLAAVGIGLRVQEYGLSPQRIIAAAWALIGAAYAIGYTLAAIKPGGWMKLLEGANVVAAWLILAVVLALFTPIADPARLSVADQIARLDAGRTKPAVFDYAFLRFHASRFGREALKGLAARKGTLADLDIAARAAKALALQDQWQFQPNGPVDLASHLMVYPKGQALPDGFVTQDWAQAGVSDLCLQGTEPCDAYLVDLDGDGTPEVLVRQYGALNAYRREGHKQWRVYGTFDVGGCEQVFNAMKTGDAKVVAGPPRADLNVAGQTLVFKPHSEPLRCPPTNTATPTKPLTPISVRVGPK